MLAGPLRGLCLKAARHCTRLGRPSAACKAANSSWAFSRCLLALYGTRLTAQGTMVPSSSSISALQQCTANQSHTKPWHTHNDCALVGKAVVSKRDFDRVSLWRRPPKARTRGLGGAVCTFKRLVCANGSRRGSSSLNKLVPTALLYHVAIDALSQQDRAATIYNQVAHSWTEVCSFRWHLMIWK